jgi:hypothetical protein
MDVQRGLSYCLEHHPVGVRFDAARRQWVPVKIEDMLPPELKDMLFLRKEMELARQVCVSCVVCCAVLCCAVLCCAVLCCAVLCCAVLCCAVLCCAMCAVLCCAVLCT